MALRAVLSFAGFGVLAAAGCGSDSAAPSSTGAPASVPPYVNLAVCANIVESGSISPSAECSTCCQNAGFADSSFINASKCTCANMPENEGASVCAARTSSSDDCQTCCDTAGFFTNLWVGGTLCSCAEKADKTSCASTVSDPNPADACASCCLQHGFLGEAYVGLGGTPTCTCLGK